MAFFGMQCIHHIFHNINAPDTDRYDCDNLYKLRAAICLSKEAMVNEQGTHVVRLQRFNRRRVGARIDHRQQQTQPIFCDARPF